MNDTTIKRQNIFALTGAVITWAAVLAQLYLIFKNKDGSVGENLIHFFSFFTILTNILVALSFTAVLFRRAAFFSKTKTLTAVAVYITIVGITYNLMLRGIWAPQGLQRIVDEALHVGVPLLFILYWLLVVPKEKLSWMHCFTWLIYPGIYLGYTLVRGNYTGSYPYPFIDLNSISLTKALINSGLICIAFIIVALLFIAMARSMAKNKV